MTTRTELSRLFVTLVLAVFGGAAFAQDLPDATADGLERIDANRVQVLYWRPGATLEPYRRIMLLDCFVSFRKDWQRDQNRNRRPSERVDAADMDRIKDALADEFRSVFERELEERGGYELVNEVGDDVLLLRPSILNLDVAAPDLQTASRNRSYVASAGSMTLHLELFDSATSSLIGRAIDSRSGTDIGQFQYANRVTNRAEADRIMSRWAGVLREALDERWAGGSR